MGSKWATLALMLVLVCTASRADSPTAADKETARTLMDEGRSLRDSNDMKGALQRFTAANEIMHVPVTAYEVASTETALGMLVEASDTLARILNMPAQSREPVQFVEARKKAQALFDSLQGRIPAVTLTLDGVKTDDTLKLTIDGVGVPSAVVGFSRSVDPGHHVVVATTNASEGNGEFDVVDGERKTLTITLVATKRQVVETSPQDLPTSEPAPEKHGRGGRLLAFVSFGVGAAALVAGGITGVLTLTTRSDLADKCFDHVCGPAQAGELSDGNTFALVSTITLAAAGAALVTGVVAFAVSKHSDKAPAPQTGFVRPWIGPSGAGIFGTF